MPTTRTKKRKKVSRQHGRKMGTHGGGARKKRKKSGHHGGGGMSGSGKRADHKKTLVQKLYGHGYFGKQGITSKGTQRDVRNRINLYDIVLNINKYGKKTAKGWEVNLKGYKILGTGEIEKETGKLIITASEASKTALEKIKKAGGEIILPKKKEKKVIEKKVEEEEKEVKE